MFLSTTYGRLYSGQHISALFKLYKLSYTSSERHGTLGIRGLPEVTIQPALPCWLLLLVGIPKGLCCSATTLTSMFV